MGAVNGTVGCAGFSDSGGEECACCSLGASVFSTLPTAVLPAEESSDACMVVACWKLAVEAGTGATTAGSEGASDTGVTVNPGELDEDSSAGVLLAERMADDAASRLL